MSMTIIYDFEKEKLMRQQNDEHATIFQNYENNKYKATHKRVTYAEFWNLPKIFINNGCTSIVTGSQEEKGGKEYIKHCKTFDCSIDRVNKIVFLKERAQDAKIINFVKEFLDSGITLNQVAKELDYRENSNMNWDDNLFEYTTEELEQIETEMINRK